MSTIAEPLAAPASYANFVPPASPPETVVEKRRLPWKKILAGSAALAVLAAAVGSFLHHAAGFETTDDAYLDGHVHAISPRINGTVLHVLVDDNARVQAGQPLVEIDPADLKLAVEAAGADLAQARANAEQVAAQVTRAQADVAAADARRAQNAAELNRVQLDFKRAEQLADGATGAISIQQLDAARAAFDATRAGQQSFVAQRAAAQAALAAAQAQRAVAAAQVQRAAAALDTARLQVDYTLIRAPVAGRVGKKNVEAGQRVQPGQPMMAIVDDNVWVVANFKESQLAHMRAGQKVTMRLDAIDGHTFTGAVQSFSPGTGAKFSLLPPDNSTGNFTKVVQRVPVKILFSAHSLGTDADRLFPGLSAIVSVSVR